MLGQMAPVLDGRTYVFATVPSAPDGLVPLMLFTEDEGVTVVVDTGQARGHGLALEQPMARITLTVHSALDGVGLTAAVSGALAEAGISCNLVAAYFHDHVFVPEADAPAALRALQALSARHRAPAPG